MSMATSHRRGVLHAVDAVWNVEGGVAAYRPCLPAPSSEPCELDGAAP